MYFETKYILHLILFLHNSTDNIKYVCHTSLFHQRRVNISRNIDTEKSTTIFKASD